MIIHAVRARRKIGIDVYESGRPVRLSMNLVFFSHCPNSIASDLNFHVAGRVCSIVVRISLVYSQENKN